MAPHVTLANAKLVFAVTGIEDQENWHGKALGDKAGSIIDEINARIQNKGNHGLGPQPVVDDAPAVTLSVKLSEPPNYTLGQKVRYIILQKIMVQNNWSAQKSLVQGHARVILLIQ